MYFLTDKQKIVTDIKSRFPNAEIYIDEPMSRHTTFRIGGKADFFLSPSCVDELIFIVDYFKKNNISITVTGNGSNILVSDEGIDGAVICIGKNFSDVKCEGEYVSALSGTLLSKIAAYALENSLSGFEFASGIPGTLGGALVMNAGAYGGEMKDIVTETKYLSTDDLKIHTFTGDEHGFAYRKSNFTDKNIIIESVLKLKKGNRDDIKAEMMSLSAKRREKQPLEYPSAGSTFKRPEGYFASKLIDDSGLRGYSCGDACVSEKHCGFVVNKGSASFEDVMGVIEHTKKTVKEKFGVTLEPEVKIIGRKRNG